MTEQGIMSSEITKGVNCDKIMSLVRLRTFLFLALSLRTSFLSFTAEWEWHSRNSETLIVQFSVHFYI